LEAGADGTRGDPPGDADGAASAAGWLLDAAAQAVKELET
jgi:hypothetical protein